METKKQMNLTELNQIMNSLTRNVKVSSIILLSNLYDIKLRTNTKRLAWINQVQIIKNLSTSSILTESLMSSCKKIMVNILTGDCLRKHLQVIGFRNDAIRLRWNPWYSTQCVSSKTCQSGLKKYRSWFDGGAMNQHRWRYRPA